MTREEHLQWCKEQAIQEYDFYTDPAEKQRNGLTSMMSNLSKHEETNSDVLMTLCFAQMMRPMTRQQFINFINGFH